MIQFILLIFILVNPISAIDFDGIESESMGYLGQPDTFLEVKATDPMLSQQNDIPRYAKDKRIRNTRIRNPQTNTATGLLHGYKHAGPGGNLHLFDYPQNSPEAYQAMASLVDNTLEQPLATQYGMWSKDGQFRYTGYLGEKDGKFFEIRIPEESVGRKVVKGKFNTIVPIDDTAIKYKWPRFFQNGLYRQRRARYRAPDIPKNPLQTPRAPRVTGAGKVTGFAGALVIDCAVSGGITGFMGGDAVEGCVDGLAGTEPVADGTITGQEELDLGTALYHGKINNPPHPDHKLFDEAGKGLLDSRVNFRTSKILDGPYQGKCIAVKNGYTVAVECGSLAGHEKVGTPTERLLEKMGELAPPPPVYMPIPVVY